MPAQIDPRVVQQDFPIFASNPGLIYLDSAATTPPPLSVIEKEVEYLREYPANVSRGMYPLADRSTVEYEAARNAIAEWIHAKSSREIVFTSGTTESINLVSFILENLVGEKSSVVATTIDHHSNFLPWKMLARRKKAEFRIIPISASGSLSVSDLHNSIDSSTIIVALPHVSNVTGIILPVREMVKRIRSIAPKAIIVLDAAQSIPHIELDTQSLDVDFIAFSGHKCFGPKGIGILWGRESILETLPPWKVGGGMVENAYSGEPVFRDIPYRFEAGTPNIGGAIALREAIRYRNSIGQENIRHHEKTITRYAIALIRDVIREAVILGPEEQDRGPIISFSIPGIHPHDIADELGKKSICVRAGTHCAQPLHAALGTPPSVRMSFSIYNSQKDVDIAINAVLEAQKKFLR